MAATSALSLSLSPAKRHLLALFALIALLVGLAIPQLTTAHAAGTFLRYHRGYSVQRGWLCYGWANGAYHCTTHWRVIGGRFISLHPSWVPSQGPQSAPAPSGSPSAGSLPLRTAICQWCSTGYGAYGASWGAVRGYAFGNCTAGAAAFAGYIPAGLGNAKDWLWNAQRRGMPTGSQPRVGATAVFQPFIQGAGNLGHVGNVVGVYGNGWFMIREEFFSWNGGGYDRVDYRYVHTGYGVDFIF